MSNQFNPPENSSYHPNIIHYPEQVALLQSAVYGDRMATNLVLTYLSSPIDDLRHIMLAAMHDWHHTRLWHNMLRCIALHRWDSSTNSHAPIDCTRRDDSKASQRIDQAITEVFIIDESTSEQNAKETVLRLGLANPEPQVRYASACLLGYRSQPDSLPFLTEALNHGDRRWKLMAIAALEILDKEECSFPLILALADLDPAVHQAASRALTELGRKAIPGLISALEHPDHHVRWYAAWALGKTGDKRAVQALADGLADEDESVLHLQ